MKEPVQRGRIYMVRMGEGIGSEQSGRRPFLVLQNDKGNKFSFTHSGVPLSSELKALYLPTHILTTDSKCLPYDSVVLVEQIGTLARWRFESYLGELDPNTLNKVEAAVSNQLGLKDIRDINKVLFIKRLTEINPALNVYLCGDCLRVLYRLKGFTITGNIDGSDKRETCILCNVAKGRQYRIVNRERINRDGKKIRRFRRKPH